MTDPIAMQNSMKAAREWAEVHLGDRSYADDIIWAYEHPEESLALLNENHLADRIENGYTDTNDETTEV